MVDRKHLAQRREIVLRDLAELDEQVEAGEIDEETADSLRANYQAELDVVNAQLGTEAKPDRHRTSAEKPESADNDGGNSRSNRRAIFGTGIVIVALSVAIFIAGGNIDDEPAGTTAASEAPGSLSVDPNAVSNEQLEAVVAENPDINAMRLALADRYFEQENYNQALDHYLFVAENEPTPAEEGRALARIGWMAYLTGQPETAEQYLQTSLTVDPTNGETKLFLGFVLLYGVDDSAAALPWLEEVAGFPDLPAAIRDQVEAAIEEARAGGG